MRVAIFIPSFGDGGAERMLVNLASALSARGVLVDFLTRSREAPYLDSLAVSVRLIETSRGGAFAEQLQLRHYLRSKRPDVVLCGKDRAGLSMQLARRLSGVPVRIVMRPGTSYSARFAELRPFSRWRARARVRRVYQGADAVVGNSAEVVADVAAAAGLPAGRMHLIRNPVVTPQLLSQAGAPLDHPWFAPGQPPVTRI